MCTTFDIQNPSSTFLYKSYFFWRLGFRTLRARTRNVEMRSDFGPIAILKRARVSVANFGYGWVIGNEVSLECFDDSGSFEI